MMMSQTVTWLSKDRNGNTVTYTKKLLVNCLVFETVSSGKRVSGNSPDGRTVIYIKSIEDIKPEDFLAKGDIDFNVSSDTITGYANSHPNVLHEVLSVARLDQCSNLSHLEVTCS